MDEEVLRAEVASMPQKKAVKWLRKHFRAENLCNKKRFPKTMGVILGETDRAKVVEDAVEFARSSGWGFKDPTELDRVADGTHKDLHVDQKIGGHLAAVCPLWVEGQLKHLERNLEEILQDGEEVAHFLCARQLGFCARRDDL